ncbi:MAG: phosphoadenosine phosphosulfate reductase family protein [Proteobacteria bacterium]|nr:phosphoadenosine phosphosulfate reductase family protein [Pseudomonadota bacterium]
MLADKITYARKLIRRTMNQGHALIMAWSGGKDSSTVMCLVLSESMAFKRDNGSSPRLVVSHANTGVENPEMERVANLDLERIRDFADKHGLDLEIRVSQPVLNDLFSVKVISGRDMPAFPGQGKAGAKGSGGARKCSVSWKIQPQTKLLRELVSGFKAQGIEPVTVTGTRFSESTARAANMNARGENAEKLWVDGGALRLSPIADWTDVDVWTFLSKERSGLESYSDFAELIELYRDASENTTIVDGVEVHSSRFGCCICTLSRDRSMERLVTVNPSKYGYMSGLLKLQKFLLKTRYDLSRRNWLCFAIDSDGYAKIRPNTYSPSMLEELLRYCLSLDEIERRSTGGNPRFELVPIEALVAINAIFSAQGHHEAFHAFRIYKEIVIDGNLVEIPDVETAPKVPIPATKYVHLGLEYQDAYYRWSGLADPYLAAVAGPGCMQHIHSAGNTVLDVNKATCFEVDTQGAWDFVHFMLEDTLERFPAGKCSRTYGYTFLTQLGTLTLAKGSQVSRVDDILRRTTWKAEAGLLDLDPRTNPEKVQEVLARALTEKEKAAKLRSEEIRVSPLTPAQRPKVSVTMVKQLKLPGLAA